MNKRIGTRIQIIALLVVLLFIAAACNLGGGSDEVTDVPSTITNIPTGGAPTRTLFPTSIAFGTQVQAVTAIPLPTRQAFATSVIILPPTVQLLPSQTPLPTSVVILSPVPGNIVAGNIQVLGSAIHPDFLQYHVEYGPDPNPSNLWFPITGAVRTPVRNSVLGIWNTNAGGSPDNNYQIRLRVVLRDGREQTTIINNIRVQNSEPTPIPTNTPEIPPPIAAFAPDIVQGEAPLAVRFTNFSQGQINTYSWDFGDGGIGSIPEPSYTYGRPGVYTVRLTVSGPGGTANVSRQINVQSANPPVASIIADPVSGESPLEVQFRDASDGQVQQYRWDFGDGETSNRRNPSHTFNEVGTYNVILEVIGPGGSSTAVQQITVEDTEFDPPDAAFSASSLEGEVPLTVQFRQQSRGEITSYLWDLDGDGITDKVNPNPSFVYNQAGEFNVKLTVIGPGGQSTTSQTVTITTPPDAPVAEFAPSASAGDAPLTVRYVDESTGEITTYEWDFDGDGNIDSNTRNPSFEFENPGTYTTRLTVIGPGGFTSHSEIITVRNPIVPPNASFLASRETGRAPLFVQFTNVSDGAQLTHEWDFDGDGLADSTSISPSFEFTEPGEYPVTLTVTNPSGSDSVSLTIIVTEAAAPVEADFDFTPETGNAPLAVTFSNTSTGDVESVEWDFNADGNTDSTSPAALFTFETEGSYTVSLTVNGEGGDSDSIEKTVVVGAPSTETPLPSETPTNTEIPDTETPTSTSVPPTETAEPDTPVPTNTPQDPTQVAILPSSTPVPATDIPTNTAIPTDAPTDIPTNTAEPATQVITPTASSAYQHSSPDRSSVPDTRGSNEYVRTSNSGHTANRSSNQHSSPDRSSNGYSGTNEYGHTNRCSNKYASTDGHTNKYNCTN